MEERERTPVRLRVTRTAEAQVRGGHPWVYDLSVASASRDDGKPGDPAALYDRRDRLFALGLYDPGSPIRVRVLAAGQPVKLGADLWRRRMAAALEARAAVAADGTTDGYRVVNGESDGLPGLVLDRYAGVAVLKLYTAAWFPYLDGLVAAVREVLAPEALVLRLSRNVAEAAAAAGLSDGAVLEGTLTTPRPVFREHGMRFEAAVTAGQKTGFFLDQRENRARVREAAAGADVLNLFSFTGGFSLASAFGGARAVTDIDISRHALEGGGRNFELNRDVRAVAACTRTAVKADVFAWLRSGDHARRFDIVVADPPSMAPRQADRDRALTAYRRLIAAAAARVRAHGLLMAASCSAHIDAESFHRTVLDAVRHDGRRWDLRETTGHAVDHPATFPEAHYLKAAFLRPRGENAEHKA